MCLVWFGLDIHGESNRMKRIKSKPEHTRRDDDENGKKIYIWAATTAAAAAAIEYKIEYKRQVVIAIEEDRENPISRRLPPEPTNERTNIRRW